MVAVLRLLRFKSCWKLISKGGTFPANWYWDPERAPLHIPVNTEGWEHGFATQLRMAQPTDIPWDFNRPQMNERAVWWIDPSWPPDFAARVRKNLKAMVRSSLECAGHQVVFMAK